MDNVTLTVKPNGDMLISVGEVVTDGSRELDEEGLAPVKITKNTSQNTVNWTIWTLLNNLAPRPGKYDLKAERIG